MTDAQSLHEALSHALAGSRAWAAGKEHLSNVTRSARFLSDACKRLDGSINASSTLCCRHISVDDLGKRHPGEWLLDGVWTEDASADELFTERFPVRIRCGLECESSTNGKELFKDLAKLIVVASEIKIFAAGMNQKSVEGAANYVSKRVSQIDRLLDHVHDEERATDWYLAFWPAPLKVEGKSLWEHLDCGRFAHLSSIRLYRRFGKSFREMETFRQ